MAMMERRNSLTARPLTDRRGLWLIAGFVVVFFVGTVALVLETANARPSDDVRLMLSSQESPEKVYKSCIADSSRSISASVYKFSEKHVFEALKAKVQEAPGIRVRLLMNDGTLDDENAQWLQELQKMGSKSVEVRLWKEVKDENFQKLHSKITLCDGTAVVGSANWSKSSCQENMELVVILRDAASVGTLENLFQTLWDDVHAQPMLMPQ